MTLSFDHPVGAQADTKEIEYVASLLQSGSNLRSDGTIQAIDVALYLQSRHGIDVSTKYIEEHLFPELGGSSSSSSNTCSSTSSSGGGDDVPTDAGGPTPFLDICQLLSITLIPYFLEQYQKQVQQQQYHQEDGVFSTILQGMLVDVMGIPTTIKKKKSRNENDDSNESDDDDEVDDHSPMLTRELLLNILETYGELGIPDTVVDEMLNAASGGGGGGKEGTTGTATTVLNGDCFLRAMVSDVQQYNLSWQDSSVSHYEDIVGERKKGDFWCRSATERVVNKTVASTTSTFDRTLTAIQSSSGTVLGVSVGMSGEKAVIRDQVNQDDKTVSGSVVTPAEMDIRSFNEQGLDAKTTAIQPSPMRNFGNNNTVEDHDRQMEDERFVEIYTAPAIDYTAETYQSQTFFVAIWLALVGTYFVYVFKNSSHSTYLACESWETVEDGMDIFVSLVCLVANAVINWTIIFFQLSILGSSFIFLGSFGAASGRSIWGLVIGMATIGTCTVVAYFYSVDSPFLSTEKSPGWGAAYMISLLMGSVVLTLQLLLLLRIVLPKTIVPWFRELTVFLTNGMARKETRTKAATVFKIDRLIDNAMEHHQERVVSLEDGTMKARTEATSSSTAFLGATGRALLNYQAQESRKERSGGIFWAWKRIVGTNKSILVEEGIWFHGRLIASNCFQVIVAVAVFFVLYAALQSSYGDPSEGVDDDAVNELYPEKWQMQLSFAVGSLAGFVAAISVAVIYIPSFISTTLKFRYGILPSLGSSTFQQYREAGTLYIQNDFVSILIDSTLFLSLTTIITFHIVSCHVMVVDLVAMLFGSMFWGCIVTVGLCFLVFGLITLLFAYPVRFDAT
jgi:hypothetical protein